jgi:hypothetical protein
VAGVWQNTFLFDEHVLSLAAAGAGSGPLCLSQEEAYTGLCPKGFNPPQLGVGSTAEGIECALVARTRLFRITAAVGATSYAVVSPTTSEWATKASAMCVSPNADLTQFRIGCGVSLLDQRLLLALNAVRSEPPINLWRPRLDWLAYLLQSTHWWSMEGAFNPYAPLSSSGGGAATACQSTSAGGRGGLNTFRYSTLDHANDASGTTLGTRLPEEGVSACVPCNYNGILYGDAICALFSPARYFSNELCLLGPLDGARESVAAAVCTECRPTVPNGVLLPLRSDAAASWWTVRVAAAASASSPADFGRVVDGKTPWSQIRCRYSCDAGYTSNNESPDAYEKQPCVACRVNAQSGKCPPGTETGVPACIDVPVGAAACGGTVVAAGPPGEANTTTNNNYLPYEASCVACEARLQKLVYDGAMQKEVPQFVFSVPPGAPNPAPRPQDCMALCNPDLYHSYALGGEEIGGGGAPIAQPVPFGQLVCSPCNNDPDFPCRGGCAEGRYFNASALAGGGTCLLCTTAPCPAGAGLYREMCHAGAAVRDAQCVPCPSEALRNPQQPPIAAGLLQTAIDAAEGAYTLSRRWLTPFELAGAPLAPIVLAVDSPHPEQCALACINNFAW